MSTRVISSRRIVVLSLLLDILDVVTCLTVALLTGSAVVFAKMAMGLADVAGSLFLVVGERRARLPRDSRHPFGHQREAFFWALLSALAMLTVGGGLSLQRGIEQLLRPEPVSDPWLAAAALALAVVTNGYTAWLALRKLGSDGDSLREALAEPARPLVKMALLRDVVGTLSAVLGLVAIGLYRLSGNTVFDAVGALVVGALMTVLALLAIGQTRALIVGRSIPEDDVERIRRAVLATPGVVALNDLAAVYAGRREVLVELDLDLADELDTAGIEALLDGLQHRVRASVPDTGAVRVDLNSPETGRRTLAGGRQALGAR